MKTKHLNLEYLEHYPEKEAYRVITLTNSVEYHPRQVLDKKDVEILCAKRGWEVKIVGAN